MAKLDAWLDAADERRGRHHLHESLLQGAVKDAVRAADLGKRATCPTFRYATHLLEDGHDIRNTAKPGPKEISK